MKVTSLKSRDTFCHAGEAAGGAVKAGRTALLERSGREEGRRPGKRAGRTPEGPGLYRDGVADPACVSVRSDSVPKGPSEQRVAEEATAQPERLKRTFCGGSGAGRIKAFSSQLSGEFGTTQMTFKRGDHLRAITDGLAHVEKACELQGILKLFDNHVLAQNFFCRVLNVLYGLKLIEMDKIQANYPAIDLGDLENRVAYQITTERRGEKIQHTLDKFVEHSLDTVYDQLRILVIGERQSAYKSVAVPTQLQFNPEVDILGTRELLLDVNKLATPRLESLAVILKEELSTPNSGANPTERQIIREYLGRYHQLVGKNRGFVLGQIMQLRLLTDFAAWQRAKSDGTLKRLAMLSNARDAMMAGPEATEIFGSVALVIPALREQMDSPTEDDIKQMEAWRQWSTLTHQLGNYGPQNDTDVQVYQQLSLAFLDATLTATATKERIVQEAAEKWLADREQKDNAP